MLKKTKAFTLIELLVVIAIIGILTTIAIVALQSSRADSRDAKRLADVRQMQKALEMYFLENGSYPTSITSGIASGTTVYMAQTPTAPTPADGSCPSYNNTYTYSSTGSSYTIDFCLGSKTGEFNAGGKRATNEGIIDYTPPVPWVCGLDFTDDRDSQRYGTMQIGTQCWMTKNLAYLPSVQNAYDFTYQGYNQGPAYGVYGYTGTDVAAAKATANYQTYGVYYNWYAAVATSSTTGTEGLQGACPTGWHVPTSAEFTTLNNTINSNANYRCNGISENIGKAMASPSGWTSNATVCNVGNNQQTNNSTGFNGLPAGERDSSNADFNFVGSYAEFWSSSISGSNVIFRSLINYFSYFYSGANNPRVGYSVRCILNN